MINIPPYNDRSDITVLPFEGISPRIHSSVFIASGARIIGDVEIGEQSSIWYNVVIRGDVHWIKIGVRTNIQDLVMCHVTNKKHPLTICNDVTIGHSAVLHGSTINDKVLVGMGAILLDKSVIGTNSIVAAGTVVKEGFVVPEGVLIAGVPGKIIRDLNDDEKLYSAKGAANYKGYVERFIKSGFELY
ncbi:MAG: gamma carbonic anhydrase family protein [Chlorobiota bacterium]|jgi:carbonic anhydrase/acetyltransferase-like protein (isoleucine patch superfamily)|nr:gamma carbonic anhydrase family protein [Chlorobiota bacterium]QQS66908.1 MAG: gamma carbonic anhydrase family protein [Chlorobiota bacterium]